jgi:hypothetical protein
MDPQYGPPNMDPHYGPLLRTPTMVLQSCSTFLIPETSTMDLGMPLNPIWDPQYGPHIWTPNIDLHYGPPNNPNMDPHYGPPVLFNFFLIPETVKKSSAQ